MRKFATVLMLLGILSFMVIFTACTANNTGNDTTGDNSVGYKDISPESAKERLDSGEDAILLDVRTPEEYRDRHIPGSLLIPLEKLEKEATGKLADKEQPIFVYCRSGNRSVTASRILSGLGYKEVYNLGGIIDWPYETE